MVELCRFLVLEAELLDVLGSGAYGSKGGYN
jgi:hypothetical protein